MIIMLKQIGKNVKWTSTNQTKNSGKTSILDFWGHIEHDKFMFCCKIYGGQSCVKILDSSHDMEFEPHTLEEF